MEKQVKKAVLNLREGLNLDQSGRVGMGKSNISPRLRTSVSKEQREENENIFSFFDRKEFTTLSSL